MSSSVLASSSNASVSASLARNVNEEGKEVKENATVATKIGLSVPIKEKIVKGFVNHLGSSDTSKIIPKQVPKATILTVSAIVEKLLQCLVQTCRNGLEGSNFNVVHVTGPIQAHESLVVLYPFFIDGLASVQVHKVTKKAKKAARTGDAAEDEPATSVDGRTENQFSFSCSNQITRLIKAGTENLRVASDAVDLIQHVLDEFYQKLLSGAYLIAQNSGRKTISQSDVLVSTKIMLPDKFAFDVLEHVSHVYARFQDLEKTKSGTKIQEKEASTKVKKASKVTEKGTNEVTTASQFAERQKPLSAKSPKKNVAAAAY